MYTLRLSDGVTYGDFLEVSHAQLCLRSRHWTGVGKNFSKGSLRVKIVLGHGVKRLAEFPGEEIHQTLNNTPMGVETLAH